MVINMTRSLYLIVGRLAAVAAADPISPGAVFHCDDRSRLDDYQWICCGFVLIRTFFWRNSLTVVNPTLFAGAISSASVGQTDGIGRSQGRWSN
jgi:hypothetical protein